MFQLAFQKPCEMDNFRHLREAMRYELGKGGDIISLAISNQKDHKISKWGFSLFSKKAILAEGRGWASNRFVAQGTGKGPSGKNESWAQLKDWFEENVKWLTIFWGESWGQRCRTKEKGGIVWTILQEESTLANEARSRKR